MDILFNPISLAIINIIILVYSAILHEIAHGFIAYRLGDPTAKTLGRLTLNPKSHIDPFMSIIFPLFLILSGSPVIFGGAKPVPVDPYNLKDGRRDLALVSLAGPLTNIILAIISALLLHLLNLLYPQTITPDTRFSIYHLAIITVSTTLRLNLLLAIFNLLPIPPLDGSKLFALLLPKKEAAAYLSLGSVGMLLLFLLLFFNLGPFSLMNFIQSLQDFALTILGF